MNAPLETLQAELRNRVALIPGLSDVDIIDFTLPSLRLVTQRVGDDDALSTGESRIGGVPDVPPVVDWPR